MTDLERKTYKETQAHISEVFLVMNIFMQEIDLRSRVHDASKLDEPELSVFANVGAELKSITYDSDEYKAALVRLGPALEHHYAHNDHHPEHFPNGIDDMNLFQIIEMFCDWVAATKRHADGSMTRSLEINQKRFGISDQLVSIFRNTAIKIGEIA